tara:strand:+ start:79 stop:375 length:297 start_codon:yes stop_codon:yes gene_type:complete
MGRYDDVPLRINRKGQRVLVSTLYPQIPLSDEDQFIFPLDGDRLDNLAFRYYGDASLWWVIATANGLGKGRTILNPNFKIRIPGNLQSILADFDSLNG